MADWSNRITPILAVGSGLGYLLGTATVSEFAAQLGLQASDLGLGAQEYVIVALLAAVAVACLLPTAILVPVFVVSAGRDIAEHIRVARERGLNRPAEFVSLAGQLVPVFFGSLWATTFLSVLLLVVPAYLVENDPLPWQSLLFGVAAGLAVAVAVVPASVARRKAVQAGRADPGRRWMLRWANGNRSLVVVAALLLFLVVFGYAVRTSAQFGELVTRAGVSEAPRTPFLLRWVVRPGPACVVSSVPTLDSARVLHVARGGGHEVLVHGGRVWLVPGGDARLTFGGDSRADCP